MTTTHGNEVELVRDRPERRGATVPATSGFEILRAKDVDLNIFCPKRAKGPVAEAAYQLWHDVWLATFQQLDGVSHLDSNEFVRQDEILVLGYRGQSISVTTLRFVDRRTRIGQDDSYFRQWPPEALENIGASVAISSNTVVADRWRRARVRPDSGGPQRLSELIIALALRRFAATTTPELVGVARNNRRMDRVAETLGGQAIGRMVLHGIDSDIMRFSRSALPAFGPTVEDIWSRRLGADIVDRLISKPNGSEEGNVVGKFLDTLRR